MDDPPFSRETFELGGSISTAGKSILNLVKWRSLVAKYRKMWKNSQTSQYYIFHILQYFATKLHNFTKFRMLFPAVLMSISSNLNAYLKGKSSIDLCLHQAR